MFSLFKRSSKPPITEDQRVWIDGCFRWLVREFGETLVRRKKVLLPTSDDFPIDFIASEENAFELLDIIARQMDLDPDRIGIDFYAEGERELATGAGSYSRVFLKPAENEKTTAGHYLGKDEDGDHIIGLNFRSMRNVEKLVATIAHELSHIKLLGEERIKENNEPLTDLTTIIFGLGIFGANSAATFETGAFSWSHGRLGYLSQMDWGYALALHSHLRGEISPQWLKYLTLNVRVDFRNSARFIEANPEEVMQRK